MAVIAALNPLVGDSATSAQETFTPRFGLVAISADGLVSAFGGFIANEAQGLVECLDPAAGDWERTSDMPTARGLFAVAEVDGIVYTIGGTRSPLVSSLQGQQRFFESGDTRGLNQNHVPKIRRILARLQAASSVRDLDVVSGSQRQPPELLMRRILTRGLIGLLILVVALLFIGKLTGARLHYADNPLAQNWDGEGPYVFLAEGGDMRIQYLQADGAGGYAAEERQEATDSPPRATVHYPLDSSRFEVVLSADFETPPSVYDDGNRIFAISDIEGNYGTLRDFLVGAGVIDEDLNWTFGTGHLVLVGDLVDRGYFVTQALWLVYKLEQDARRHGGHVHYIIGNHELKMMYGDYGATDPKYAAVAATLGKTQSDLYGPESLLGRWMASKNAVEQINGVLFVHGGLHPDVADLDLDVEAINQRIRRSYYQPVSRESAELEGDVLVSRDSGACWYRGYFKDDLSQDEIDRALERFDARAVVVGHTLQKRVDAHHGGKVLAIDVAHPNDDHKLWPEGHSEGLLIDNGVYYRVLEGGAKEAI